MPAETRDANLADSDPGLIRVRNRPLPRITAELIVAKIIDMIIDMG